MLGIILAILKTIGIILLILLAVFLLLIILVLFVPIRYEASLYVPEKRFSNKEIDFLDGICAVFRFNWFLHFIRGEVAYPDKKDFTLKVLFFRILPKKEKSKVALEGEHNGKKANNITRKAKENLDSQENHEIVNNDFDDFVDNDYSNSSEDQENKEKTLDSNSYGEKEETTSFEGINKEKESSEVYSNSKEEKSDFSNNKAQEEDTFYNDEDKPRQDRGFFAFIAKIKEKIMRLTDKISKFKVFFDGKTNSIKKLIYTISSVCDKIKAIYNVLESKTFDKAYTRATKEIFFIARCLLPRKFDADLLFGTGDPADTANLLSALYILNSFSRYSITLEPDFNDVVIRADIKIKGKLTIFFILISACKIYFDKNIRKVLHRFDIIMHGRKK